jgi:hypothetical protein
LCHVFKSIMKDNMLEEAERQLALCHLPSWRCFLRPALYNLEGRAIENLLVSCVYIKCIQFRYFPFTFLSLHILYPQSEVFR